MSHSNKPLFHGPFLNVSISHVAVKGWRGRRDTQVHTCPCKHAPKSLESSAYKGKCELELLCNLSIPRQPRDKWIHSRRGHGRAACSSATSCLASYSLGVMNVPLPRSTRSSAIQVAVSLLHALQRAVVLLVFKSSGMARNSTLVMESPFSVASSSAGAVANATFTSSTKNAMLSKTTWP